MKQLWLQVQALMLQNFSSKRIRGNSLVFDLLLQGLKEINWQCPFFI